MNGMAQVDTGPERRVPGFVDAGVSLWCNLHAYTAESDGLPRAEQRADIDSQMGYDLFANTDHARSTTLPDLAGSLLLRLGTEIILPGFDTLRVWRMAHARARCGPATSMLRPAPHSRI